MSHPIPSEAQCLADRLRMLADEIESAARYGVPIPFSFSVTGHKHGRAQFSASSEEFDAWAEYTEATTEEYDHAGSHWTSAIADVNGLPMSFACKQGPTCEHDRRIYPGADQGCCMKCGAAPEAVSA